MLSEATVFVVDDDPSVADALRELAASINLNVELFSTAEEFLSAYDRSRVGCLVLDVRLAQMSGLHLLARMAQERQDMPIIMISACADVQMAVEAMEKGALTFLQKPFHGQHLVAYIQKAIHLHSERKRQLAEREEVNQRIDRLTNKEREVMEMLAEGMTNKAIAGRLHLGLRAIEDRRARMMKKLAVSSLHEVVALVRRAYQLNRS